MEGEAVFSMPLRPQALYLAGLLFFALRTFSCKAGDPAPAAAADWVITNQDNDVTIYSRVHPGGTMKEYKAVGTVAVAPRVLQAVLDDVESYPKFMPYITECKILKREKASLVSYQRVSPPFCTDRDYTLRVKHETKSTKDGMVYICRWELANELGPAEKSDIIRVKINEGSWTMEPTDGNTTRATYYVYADSGSLPAWLAAKANQIAIGKLFEALRKQAKDAKYADSK